MARFERVPLEPAQWHQVLSTFDDRIVFQTPAWLAFLAEMQGAEPVLAELKDGNESLSYLPGMILKKMGLRIFGSPFPGWSTPYMGFNLRPGVPRRVAVEALSDFVFRAAEFCRRPPSLEDADKKAEHKQDDADGGDDHLGGGSDT
jgi:hypothetical protein